MINLGKRSFFLLDIYMRLPWVAIPILFWLLLDSGEISPLFEASLEFEVQYPQIGRMITLPQLLGNAKCFETVRVLR
jgi:hypothetical protein